MEDNQIIDLFFERDEAGLTESRRKYGLRLHKAAMNILHNREDAEECVNDTMMRAWYAIPPARPMHFGAFLAKTVRNLSINKWKARGAAKRGGGEAGLLFSELEESIPSPVGTEGAYEAQQVTQAINAFLGGLEQSARVAFVLRYFYGDSIRDISEHFQMSESKIKSMLFRTRNRLKLHLEKEGITI